MFESSFEWNFGTSCMKLYKYWTLPWIIFEIYSAFNKVAYCIFYYIVLYPVSAGALSKHFFWPPYDPAQKRPMLKQGVKTINPEFIRTHALSQLSFVQFRPFAISFPGLLLSLTLMPLLRQGLRVFFRMWIICKIGAVILFKRNMAEKDVCRAHTFRSLNCNFYTVDDS